MAPSVYDHLDYRQFLRAWYESEKARLPAFSYRYFARKAGFSSPNFLKLVIDGERNLSAESIERFIGVLKLGGDEASFFRDLVAYNQARSLAEKNVLFDRVIASKRFRQARMLDGALIEVFGHWWHAAIRELAARPDFSEDPDWIAERLWGEVSREDIRRSLLVLEGVGLLTRDEGGRLIRPPDDSTVSTGPEVVGASRVVAKAYLRQMMEQASESLDRIPAPLRDIGCITVAVKESTIAELKERVRNFRRELLERCDEDEEPTSVYQLNLQLFPLTRPPKE